MASYIEEVLADAPKVLYPLDDTGGDFADWSGNAHPISVVGAPTYRVATSLTGLPYGVTFASGTYAKLESVADVDLGNGPFTIEFWVKRPTDATANGFIGKRDGVATPGYGVVINSSDLVRLEDGSTSSNVSSQTGSLLNNTNWNHIVLTRGSGTTGTVYINGSVDTPATSAKTFANATQALLLGRDTVGQTSDGFSLSMVAIYKSELSSARVTAHYGARNTASPTMQQLRPDADTATTGWTTTPLWSKVDESSAGGDVITATAS